LDNCSVHPDAYLRVHGRFIPNEITQLGAWADSISALGSHLNNLIMNVIVNRGGYGFGHTWTLEVYGKQYYLGQDVKFCSRVLGMSPSDVVMAIGTNRLDTDKGTKALARFIVAELGIKKSSKIEPWGLCSE